MLIFACIYAILGVEFYSTFGAQGDYLTFYLDEDGVMQNTSLPSTTARGYHHGEEYFGTFSRALYTMFQVMTGEAWSEMVARPLLFGWSGIGTGLFYVTFILLMQIILTNVVVAGDLHHPSIRLLTSLSSSSLSTHPIPPFHSARIQCCSRRWWQTMTYRPQAQALAASSQLPSSARAA